jgi:formylmethanofuran dehydrogenase subunit E
MPPIREKGEVICMCDESGDTHDHGFIEEYPAFEECVRFHGHSCPGLGTGYRVAVAAMRALGVARPYDEELVAIAETDACGVDAVQMVTGCTAGKGNLVVKDYGKHAFTLISRERNRAVRILVNHEDMPERSEMDALRRKVFSDAATDAERERFYDLMRAATERILTLPEDRVLTVTEVSVEPPEKARIFTTVTCACCGESVADEKTRILDGKRVCIPCHDEQARR